MQVEVWSDVACPWCAVGKRRLEAALARFEHRDEVDVRWRSFELDPAAPPVRDGDYARRLADKYGSSLDAARAMIDRMTATAAADGWRFRFDRIRPGNTFDAHRLLHLAAERGVQDAVKEALLSAYLEDGVAIGDHDALAAVAAAAGLEPGEVGDVLAGDRYAAEVRADEQQAHAFGITGVPFFVLDRRYGVSGAQPADVLLQALRQAWSERTPLAMVGVDAPRDHGHVHDHGHDHGEACADGSCAI
ncbi:DsbA family oxidoreductase [Egicoccus sp. AB-alg2]|uniref:DsbA family oxidoreductase n=1 Tax=Egicoccus sp. AB-alg2 TaxID=3242693 RepID=UPI00359CF49F